MSIIDTIESAARLATQGEWKWSDGFLWNETEDRGVLAHGELVEWPVSPENAHHIALACPENVLKLIAIVHAAANWESVTADLKSSANDIGEACHQLRKALRTLESK